MPIHYYDLIDAALVLLPVALGLAVLATFALRMHHAH